MALPDPLAPDDGPTVPDDKRTVALLDAARSVIVDFGIRRMTIDDVVKRSGVSRMTVYRRFSGRDELVTAVIRRELEQNAATILAAVRDTEGAEARLIEAFTTATRVVEGNSLLTRLFELEPELLLPYLTTRAEPFVAGSIAFMRPFVRAVRVAAGDPDPDAGLDETAEIIGRIGMSLLLTPAVVLDLSDDDAVRTFAREHLLPIARRTG
ncbi:MAG: TetR/AcrR family transcriptional regulator [Solirubrobacteraceae bacterium]|nr:TetR/AcrR family transcriptional regulator [Solirubrobacteraceae bacterium]